MAVGTNYTNTSVDSNLQTYEAQKAARGEEITSSVGLSDKQKELFKNPDSSVSVDTTSKKDDAGNSTQSSNNDIKDNMNASKENSAQSKLLNQIKNKMEAVSQDGLSDDQKASMQKELDSMVQAYDTIAKTTGTKSTQETLKSEQSGKTTVDATTDISQSGIAKVTLKSNNGNDINIRASLDSNNMEKSLNNFAQEINKQTSETGVTASVVYDEKTGSGKILFSKEGNESVDYKMEVDNGKNKTAITTEKSATFSLSDLSSKNTDTVNAKLESLGVSAPTGMNGLLESTVGKSIASNVITNASNQLNDRQTNIDNTIKTIQENATKLLDQIKNSSVNNFNYAMEASNGLQGLSELSQAGSMVMAQANPIQSNVLKLLA
jgi:hypothetical protein